MLNFSVLSLLSPVRFHHPQQTALLFSFQLHEVLELTTDLFRQVLFPSLTATYKCRIMILSLINFESILLELIEVKTQDIWSGELILFDVVSARYLYNFCTVTWSVSSIWVVPAAKRIANRAKQFQSFYSWGWGINFFSSWQTSSKI